MEIDRDDATALIDELLEERERLRNDVVVLSGVVRSLISLFRDGESLAPGVLDAALRHVEADIKSTTDGECRSSDQNKRNQK